MIGKEDGDSFSSRDREEEGRTDGDNITTNENEAEGANYKK